jgi:hypothetical protein
VTNDGDLGPILTTAEEEAIVGGSRGSRRSGRRGGSAGEASGMTGPDLEEVGVRASPTHAKSPPVDCWSDALHSS